MGGPGPRLSPSAGPATAPAVRAVQLAVRRALSGVAPASVVIVGVSGGADSMALLAAAIHVAQPLRLRVHAVCVDHGWHPRTRTVAVAVARAAAELGADDVRTIRVQPARTAAGAWVGGAEDAARQARLRALRGAAERDGAWAVLLGHTLDDQAEQVLLSLARGSGARSLGGMADQREEFVRPLLRLRRDVVRAACPELDTHHLPWQDPANTEPAYLRTRVRAELMPVLSEVLGAGAVESLTRSAELLRADDAALRLWSAREVEALLGEGHVPGSPVEVPVATLAALPEAVRTRSLRLLAAMAGAQALSLAHTRSIDELLVAWSGQGPTHLPGQVKAWRVSDATGCGRLRFARDTPPREDPHGRP